MKILSIGYLPKEVGGSYTTGIARVVYALSEQQIDGVQTFMYATNTKNSVARKLCAYKNQYIGYSYKLGAILLDVIFHPRRTIREWRFYKNNCFENPLRFEFFKVNIESAIRQVRPDLIHVHSALPATYFANRKYGIPVLQTLHGVMWDLEDGDNRAKKIYQATIPLVDYFTGLNQEVERKMLNLGIPKEKITLIPNGVDSGKFYFSQDKRKEFREKYGVDDDTVVFMTVGLVIDRKGQFDFMQILESLDVKYQYWIFGNGPDFDKIKAYCDEHNLNDKVKLMGYVKDTDLYQFHSAADVYAHASTTEGQALSEIEAYSTGLRVIVNKKIADTVAGNSREDKATYYVMDFNDVDQDEALQWINNKPERRESRQNFDWHCIQQRYVDLYRSLL